MKLKKSCTDRLHVRTEEEKQFDFEQIKKIILAKQNSPRTLKAQENLGIDTSYFQMKPPSKASQKTIKENIEEAHEKFRDKMIKSKPFI